MNRRSLFKVLGTFAAGLLLPPLRAAKALPGKVSSRVARWRHHPSPTWLEAYGGHHVATVTRPSRAARVNIADDATFRAALLDTGATPVRSTPVTRGPNEGKFTLQESESGPLLLDPAVPGRLEREYADSGDHHGMRRVLVRNV